MMKLFVSIEERAKFQSVFMPSEAFGSNRHNGVIFKFSFSLNGKQERAVVAHGSDDGRLKWQNHLIGSTELCEQLAKMGYQGKFYLISCHPKSKSNSGIIKCAGITLINCYPEVKECIYYDNKYMNIDMIKIGRH